MSANVLSPRRPAEDWRTAGVLGVELIACIVAVWVLALLSLALALPLEAISAVDPDEDAAEKLQRPNGNT